MRDICAKSFGRMPISSRNRLSPLDSATCLVVVLVVVGAALAACGPPVRRATKADPITVLRCE